MIASTRSADSLAGDLGHFGKRGSWAALVRSSCSIQAVRFLHLFGVLESVLLALDGITMLADRVVPLAIHCFLSNLTSHFPKHFRRPLEHCLPSFAILGSLLLVVHIFGFVPHPQDTRRSPCRLCCPSCRCVFERAQRTLDPFAWRRPTRETHRARCWAKDAPPPLRSANALHSKTKRFDETISEAMETSIRDLEAHPLGTSIGQLIHGAWAPTEERVRIC